MKARRIFFILVMLAAFLAPVNNLIAAEENVVLDIQGMTCDL